FELESVLIEHEAGAEAAVVPSPDPLRRAVPRAYVVVSETSAADAETARSILAYCRETLAPDKPTRRRARAALPKTLSVTTRRGELRAREDQLHPCAGEPVVEGNEYADTDFGLKG